MNSEINNMLRRDKINYDKLRKIFEYEFDLFIHDFFPCIIKFVNSNNKKNVNKVKELLSFLKDSIDNIDDDKLDSIVINLINVRDKISNNDILLEVNKLLNDIYYENSDEYKIDMGSFLKHLIHEDKNIRRLKVFLNDVDKSFLYSEDYDGILSGLLKKFNSKDRDVKKYYYEVSIMLIDKISNNLLNKNRKKYLDILDNLKVHSEYSDDLFSLINGKYISDDVLLSRFGVSSDFPYSGDSFNTIVKDKEIPNLKQGAITIDKNNTVKMDDAIYFKKNRDNTYTLYVHVSFVPSLIDYESIVNEEARRRYKSLYAFDKVIPILSNDLVMNKFSLIKNNYRNVATFSVKVDRDMKIISDTFKITRTNVRVVNNYDYDTVNKKIKCDSDDMLKYLSVFALNNLGSDIDVDRAFGDNKYYSSLISDKDNLARDIVFLVMRANNYCVSKYFRDRGFPYLYKYSSFDEDRCNEFNSVVSGNKSVVRYDDLVKKLNDTFFDIKLSSEPKSFFDLDCYSSSTDPLWKYSALYNQYLLNNFIFLKNNGTDSIEEWYNSTRALAKELNLKKQNNRNIETVCKSLSKIRSRY